ncbi:hypothetical protein [Dietzia lutea]|uniref:hypothetical protein n=1 Tax=Dietzia lutea TaxID=546160 RepID=UPI003134598B
MQRWLNMAKVATPVLLPLVYKVVSNAQSSDKTAEAAGSTSRQPASTPPASTPPAPPPPWVRGSSASTGSRRAAVASGGQGFRRLHPHAPDRPAHGRRDRRDHAHRQRRETTPTAQRREIHSSISGELDRVNKA